MCDRQGCCVNDALSRGVGLIVMVIVQLRMRLYADIGRLVDETVKLGTALL